MWAFWFDEFIYAKFAVVFAFGLLASLAFDTGLASSFRVERWTITRAEIGGHWLGLGWFQVSYHDGTRTAKTPFSQERGEIKLRRNGTVTANTNR